MWELIFANCSSRAFKLQWCLGTLANVFCEQNTSAAVYHCTTSVDFPICASTNCTHSQSCGRLLHFSTLFLLLSMFGVIKLCYHEHMCTSSRLISHWTRVLTTNRLDRKALSACPATVMILGSRTETLLTS